MKCTYRLPLRVCVSVCVCACCVIKYHVFFLIDLFIFYFFFFISCLVVEDDDDIDLVAPFIFFFFYSSNELSRTFWVKHISATASSSQTVLYVCFSSSAHVWFSEMTSSMDNNNNKRDQNKSIVISAPFVYRGIYIFSYFYFACLFTRRSSAEKIK